MRHRTGILCVFFLHSVSVQPLVGQWSTDPTINNPISMEADRQSDPRITSDGSGGAIITWIDRRNGLNLDIYAQRIDSAGQVQWAIDGVAISTAAGNQSGQVITSDGSGGAIITWHDRRNDLNYDLYAQRVNSAGVVQWTANGVAVSTAAGDQIEGEITSDGSGGAIITWQDRRNGLNGDIYAQRLNSAGQVQWAPDGVAVSTAAGDQIGQVVTSDGSGGAIITWQDRRNGLNGDIYAQRINSAGQVQWAPDGVAISTAAGNQAGQVVTSDGSGGAIITWGDARTGSTESIYAQRINSAGAVEWTTDGVEIAGAAPGQSSPAIATDGSAGAIITWYNFRNAATTTWDIYAQRINSGGVEQWTPDGVAVSMAAGTQVTPEIVSDGSGGAIIAWDDSRDLLTNDLYAQRINGAGQLQWTPDGVAISTAGGRPFGHVATSDGSGGAIITWYDNRKSNDDLDIHAQNVDKFGYLGINTPSLTTVRDVAGDQGGKVALAWDGADLDAYPHRVITYYSVWRGIELTAKPAGAGFIGPEDMTLEAHGPAYRSMMTSSGATYWEWLENVPSHSLAGYSFTAPTTSDSTAAGTPVFGFFVSAHTENQFVFWDSNIESGYSVDNLRPEAVRSLIAGIQAGPSVLLQWDKNTRDPDVGSYEVHRSRVDGFTPDPSTRIGQAAGLMLTDGAPEQGTRNYYRVVTVDIHGNRSIPSEQASVIITGVQEPATGVPTSYALEQNYPNPFNPTTMIRYAVPEAAHVKLALYSVLGEEVAVLVDERQEAGYRSVTWHATNVPNGVYFYRMEAGNFSEARKLVLLR